MIETHAATVPDQPVSTPPLKKGFPVALILIGVIVVIAIANLTNLVGGKGKTPVRSNLSTQPTSISPQQVKSYQTMQATEARRDAEDRQQHGINQAGAAPQQAAGYPASDIPGPEADTAAPMTAAQRQSIYGDSPNAPQKTSNASQSHAEARQRQLAREKQQQDAVNSDTIAIDFGRPSGGTMAPASALADRQQDVAQAIGEELRPQQPAGPVNAAPRPTPTQTAAVIKTDPMAPYPFDDYQGKLFRVFEGTVLEGVVTNHIDGGFNGPILVMLTTDYYSHDHQQLLMPQGTRLIGSVQSVGSQGQRKLFVTFHRAVCPDGFSLEFDKYIGLDPIGTTGLASQRRTTTYFRASLRRRCGIWADSAASRRSATMPASSHLPQPRYADGLSSSKPAQEGRTDSEPLPQPLCRSITLQGGLARPGVHRARHPHSFLRGASRRPHPLTLTNEEVA